MNVKIAVGDVVLNRMHNPDYPHTLKGVVFQVVQGHYAFESVQNGYIYTQPSDASWQAARSVLYDHVNLMPDALVFYNPQQTPPGNWVWSRPVVAQLGDFVFAR